MNNNFQNISGKNIERHVVLIAPEVPWNTGNVGRTCLGVGAFLHLIKPLEFSRDEWDAFVKGVKAGEFDV